MAILEIPEKEVHARFYNNGLTKYTYEEIARAIQEYQACQEENTNLAAQASLLIGDHDKYPGLIHYAPEPIQRLYDLLCSENSPDHCGCGARGSKEYWPVATWQKEIKKWYRWNKKIQTAIENCQKEGC